MSAGVVRRHRSAGTRLAAAVAVPALLALLAGACTPEETAAPGTTAAGGASDGTAGDASALSVPRGTEGFAALNPAIGYGLLRVMMLEEWPNPQDVVIYRALPNELPRVAGVLTTVGQTPLSHVNLRAVQDAVPNAYVADALDDPAVAALVGRYVRCAVTADGFTIEAATQAEVEQHHAALRPTGEQTPERDITETAIRPLSEVAFDDWDIFGVKAANLATLRTLDLAGVEVPDGYAVPFSFYDGFMQANGFYDRVRALLADEAFRTDPAVTERELDALRDDIEDAPMPAWMMTALDEVQRSFPEGTPIRCRSSTNNEDLPDFSGAGLYDSKTQRPDEGHLAKCVKQVYASVWNLRAYLARDFYRIDHLTTAMGVLLHPNFDDEQVNGVAVSADPVYDTPDTFYVNAQLGEDLVTNPDGEAIPEALLLGPDGSSAMISHSNLIEPGERLLDDARLATLATALGTIHHEFAARYNIGPDERFAMEIEFKVTAAGALSIKQARTWIFR
ncbi:MAG: PEP/pyruvate-binding domain-containing protein [Acidimicrobiales bacterium]